ncbi:MAG: hypothetical protein ABH840_04610 [Nanoarchaeota archaeon]
MKILFICKYNRFRSRIAEAYFNKVNKNPNIQAEGAGIIQGWFPLDESEIETAKEFDLDADGQPRALSTELLRQQDKIIIVANNVPESIFEKVMIADNTPASFSEGKNLIVWKIQDEEKGDKENIRKIIKSIMSNVDNLVIELKEEK